MSKLDDSRVLHVKRGNQEAVLPVTGDAARELPVAELATVVAKEMLRGQLRDPGRATKPIPMDGTPLALRVNGRDTALAPDLPLLVQTAGCWSDRDLPVQGQTDATARLPVCEVELIDAQRTPLVVAA